jgi:hypothetical protein
MLVMKLIYANDVNLLGKNMNTIKNADSLVGASNEVGLVLLYVSESWTLNKDNEERLKIFERKILRKTYDQLMKEEYGTSDIIMNCINFTMNQMQLGRYKLAESGGWDTYFEWTIPVPVRKQLLTIRMAIRELKDLQQGG